MHKVIKTTFYSIKNLKTGMYLTFDLEDTVNIDKMYTRTDLADLNKFIIANNLTCNPDYSIVTWNLEWAVP